MCERCDQIRKLDREIQNIYERLTANITLYRHCVSDRSVGAEEAQKRAHHELDNLLSALARKTQAENDLAENGHGDYGSYLGMKQ